MLYICRSSPTFSRFSHHHVAKISYVGQSLLRCGFILSVIHSVSARFENIIHTTGHKTALVLLRIYLGSRAWTARRAARRGAVRGEPSHALAQTHAHIAPSPGDQEASETQQPSTATGTLTLSRAHVSFAELPAGSMIVLAASLPTTVLDGHIGYGAMGSMLLQ
eukprot:6198269-Pleurochrysis_carterae.AAC.5